MKPMDVQMVKVRSALKKLHIDVRTEWGSGGWAIVSADKAKLRRLMSGEGESSARRVA